MDRSPKPSRVILLPAAALALLAGCAAPEPPVTQERSVDSFSSIALRGAAEVKVTQGTPARLVVRGTPAALDELVTRVEHGRLLIETRAASFWRRRGPLQVEATLPHLAAFELGGAGQVRLQGLDGGATEIELSGAGQISGSGRVDRLVVSLNGAGQADLGSLVAAEAEVSVNGAGQAEVNVVGPLRATVNGVGQILYTGEPTQVQTQLNGVGSIRRR